MPCLSRGLVLAALLTCALCISFAHPVRANTPNSVLVGVYVLNVGEIDLRTGSYTMDFYLSMRCGAARCNLGSFEFMNGRASSITLEYNSSNERVWRIQANLYENLDLHEYPFDSHALQIRIEDVSLTTQNLTYVPDPKVSGVDPSVVVVGWSITGWSQTVGDHYYSIYNETYSQYVFSVTLDRRPTSAFEIFIPVFLLTFLALLSTLMFGDVSSVFENRILLTASLLVAAVLFQFSLDSDLPPLGYLTFADWFMIATYVVLVAGLISGILALRYHHKRDLVNLQKLHRYSVRLVPLLALVAYALALLLLL